MEDTKTNANSINLSHKLDGSPETLGTYYDKWAKNYDADVQEENYTAPEYIAQYTLRIATAISSRTDSIKDIKIFDAGCGTGLVGKELQKLRFEQIDGGDLSPEMIEVAKETSCYTNLYSEVDLHKVNHKINAAYYDLCICCGVFTLGHVKPQAIDELLRITKPNGIILLSTRKRYYETTHFKEYITNLQKRGTKVLEVIKDAPYINDENAHYWLLQNTSTGK